MKVPSLILVAAGSDDACRAPGAFADTVFAPLTAFVGDV